MTPTEEETRVWIAFNFAHRRIHHDMEDALAREGLPSLKWYDVLWAIEMTGQDGVRARKLRDWLLFEQSNLSRVLSKLVADGLVQETPCDIDRRAKILRITPEGQTLRLKMWRVYGEKIHEHMRQLIASRSPSDLLDMLGSYEFPASGTR